MAPYGSENFQTLLILQFYSFLQLLLQAPDGCPHAFFFLESWKF